MRGFEKEAGFFQRLKDKVKGHITGKEYLYHGTNSSNAARIAAAGVTPDKRGISKHVFTELMPNGPKAETISARNAGMVFTTKDKDIAKMYAKQSQGLHVAKKMNAYARLLASKLPEGKIKKGIREATHKDVRRVTSPLIAKSYVGLPLVPGGKVVSMAVPKEHLSGKTVSNPEIETLANKVHTLKNILTKGKPKAEKMLSEGIGKKIYEKAVDVASKTPFKHDVVVKGSLAAKFIKRIK